MSDPPQARLGRYILQSELGCGGFAVVYRALDTSLEREIALKVLKPGWTDDQKAVQRFLREADLTARLIHPHIVRILDCGQDEGRLFIAMERIEGRSLQQFVADDGPVPWTQMLTIMGQVAQALDFAHQQGMVHRDVKPANILLDESQPDAPTRAVLTDFGLVRGTEQATLSIGLTSGSLLGTPEYIAPEVWQGQTATPATDLYALACVVFYLLTGRALFGATNPMAVLMRHQQGPVFSETWPADVPADAAQVLRQALAQDPAQRPASAQAFVAALAACTMPAPNIVRTDQLDAAPLDSPMTDGGSESTDRVAPPMTPLSVEDTDQAPSLFESGSAGAAPGPESESAATVPGPESEPDPAPAPADHRTRASWRRWLVLTGGALVVLLGFLFYRSPGGSPAAPTPGDAQPTVATGVNDSPTPAPRSEAVVNAATLNLRSGPGEAYAVIDSYGRDTPLTVLGQASGGEWLKVRAPEGKIGWMKTSLLQVNIAVAAVPVVAAPPTPRITALANTVEPATSFALPMRAEAVVNTATLNLRSGPGENYAIMNSYASGTVLTVLAQATDGSWLLVKTPDGKTGWMKTSLLQVNVSLTQIPVATAQPAARIPAAKATTVALLPAPVITEPAGGGLYFNRDTVVTVCWKWSYPLGNNDWFVVAGGGHPNYHTKEHCTGIRGQEYSSGAGAMVYVASFTSAPGLGGTEISRVSSESRYVWIYWN